MKKRYLALAAGILLVTVSCNNNKDDKKLTDTVIMDSTTSYAATHLASYTTVKLTADLSKLTDSERRMLPLLIDAADVMNDLYWLQCYGPQKDSLLQAVKDEKTNAFIRINYGPWDKLNNDTPFVAGVGPKPAGANFYPPHMTKAELDQSNVPDKHGQYSLIRRDSTGKLYSIAYHDAYKVQLQKAAGFLKQAALLASDPALNKYLNMRAEALITDNYNPSDAA